MTASSLPPAPGQKASAIGLPDWVVWGGLLACGSKHPTVTLLAMLGMFGVTCLSGRALSVLTARLIVLLFALVATLSLHQFPLMLEGWSEFGYVFKLLVFGVMAYWCGAASFSQGRSPTAVLMAPLSIGLGFSGFALASAVASGFLTHGTLILTLYATDIVTGITVHKTHMGMYASLGMCFLPVALGFGPKRCGGWIVWLLMLAASTMGLAANLATQNRTPLIALAACFTAVGWLKWRDGDFKIKSLADVTTRVFVLMAVGCAIATSLYFMFDALSDTLLLAFKKSAFDTPRYKVWATMIEHFGDYFWGGRKIRLPEAFAHNFWLDALWDSGIPAFCAWLGFVLVHGVFLVGIVKSTWPTVVKTAVLCTSLSFLFSMLVEPAASASISYLLALLFMLGLLAGPQRKGSPA